MGQVGEGEIVTALRALSSLRGASPEENKMGPWEVDPWIDSPSWE